MTQEEKMLLLQDLCARLPYRVKCHYNCVISYDTMVISKANAEGELKGIIPLSDGHIGFMVDYDKINALEGDIKPYLRPMSSMTEEEDKEYTEVIVKSQDCSLENSESATTMANDWLLSKGFDVRGLISKGLALEAPEDMYDTKTE